MAQFVKNYRKIPKRFRITKENCKGTILHLGGSNKERGLSLNSYIAKNFNITNVDILPGSDIVQDLNKTSWNIKDTYDTVIAPEIIEHVKNPYQFVENCCKLVKPRGRIIISTPNASSLIYFYNPRWCVEDRDGSIVHISCFTMGMIEKLLRLNGFKVTKKFYLNEYLFNPLGKLICDLIPRLRGDMLVVAERVS